MAAPVSAIQLAANRANALNSTGPKTAEGQLASSSNSRTHGLTARQALLPGEDQGEYELHHQSYRDLYRPADWINTQLVTELADLEWRLGRVPAFEALILSVEVRRLTMDPEMKPLIDALKSDNEILALAFTRLVQNKVLPNLLSHEARLTRRIDKIRRLLENPEPSEQAPAIAADAKPDAQPPPKIENQKNEAIPQPISVIKVGRNETCPCGSGLKYKRCCLNQRTTINDHAAS